MTDSTHRMPLVEALQVLHAARTDEVLISTMGTGREWTRFEPHPLDLVYVPSSMGQSPSIGLGIALAQPNRKVIACNGDGSMLMNLGSLITITSQMPTNLIILLFDNGVYEVTGHQQTPGSAGLRADGRFIDFVALAKECGFPSTFQFNDLDAWKDGLADVLSAAGPTFCCLKVQPIEGDTSPKSPGPAWERAERLRNALTS